jgi:hypothetical protein
LSSIVLKIPYESQSFHAALTDATLRDRVQEWWEQCTRNAEKEGLTPLLLVKQSRKEPLAVLRWSDLLALLRHDHRWQNLAEGLTGGRA